MINARQIRKILTNTMQVFDLFVSIMGVIALVFSFFLLLVSTTQNIKENVWEYGCLRAIGFTNAQGMRMFMYEQFSVIITSTILGSLVGSILAFVTAK